MNELISRGFVRGKFPRSDLSDHAAVKNYMKADYPSVADTLLEPGAASVRGTYSEPLPLPTPAPMPSLNVGTIARQQGYTGSQCSVCESVRMKISGHCEVCEDCGTTTGCS